MKNERLRGTLNFGRREIENSEVFRNILSVNLTLLQSRNELEFEIILPRQFPYYFPNYFGDNEQFCQVQTPPRFDKSDDAKAYFRKKAKFENKILVKLQATTIAR